MALEVKPQKKRLSVNNIKNTNKQAKKKKKQIGHSKFMYTYTLRKELSVESGRAGEERGERFGQLDKPCIFAIQGSYRGLPRWQTGDGQGGEGRGKEPRLRVHLFFGAWAVRGGVTGRPEFTPPYWYFAFFSEGFRILKKKKINM